MLSRARKILLADKSPVSKWQLRTFTTSISLLQKPNAVATPEYFEGELEPNAPNHRCYVLLHASQPPSEFPSIYKTSLSQELQGRAKRWGGIVNFSWFPGEQSSSSHVQAATVFSATSGRLEIPHISLENMDEVEKAIQDHIDGPCSELTSEEIHIYVCTHGQRDCRCGDRGHKVYDALVTVVKDARAKDPGGPASRIRIGEVGHVGGHKFAANLLYFPQGEWLGLVKPDDAPTIVERACRDLTEGLVKPLGLSEKPVFPAHWRGRMGLTKDGQEELHAAMRVFK